jgi:hypothetical protein
VCLNSIVKSLKKLPPSFKSRALSYLVFWIGSQVFNQGLASAHDPPTNASFTVGITGIYHCAQITEMRVSLTFLPRLASNHDPPYLHFSSS